MVKGVCVFASTLCNYDLKKSDLFVLNCVCVAKIYCKFVYVNCIESIAHVQSHKYPKVDHVFAKSSFYINSFHYLIPYILTVLIFAEKNIFLNHSYK